jgi:hypothetical protein
MPRAGVAARGIEKGIMNTNLMASVNSIMVAVLPVRSPGALRPPRL